MKLLSYQQLMFWTPELDGLYNITEILAEKDQTGVQTATVIECILIIFLFFGHATHTVYGISIPWPGTELVPTAVKVQNLSYWPAREFY